MATVVASLGLGLLPSAAHADPATSSETSSSVQAQVIKMQGDLANANEKYLDAKIELDKQTAAAAAAQTQFDAAKADVDAAKVQVAAIGATSYKTSNAQSLQAILTSSSPQDLIDQLGTLDTISAYNAQTLAKYAKAQKSAAANKTAIDGAKAAAAAAEKQISDKKAYYEAELPTLQAKLATLTAAQQVQVDQASGQTQGASAPKAVTAPAAAPTAAPAASGSAAQVVTTAMAQQGKPYVFGAAGPGSFDCSGLTMYAYASIGISLPHSSGAQRGYGTPVSLSALAPGDLVFAPGHVAIYIGNGTVVHAPTPGSPVRTMPMKYMNFDAARRLV
ncbi:C40 family peptidase [Antricoccus suffuscus]|nr:C40 family peptidase [Antricoccus suffuscus]